MENENLTSSDYILKLREIYIHHHNDIVLEMMEYYNVNAIRELSLDQIKLFYELKKDKIYEHDRIIY